MKKILLLTFLLLSSFVLTAKDISWTDASSLHLYGKITGNTAHPYVRLPESFKDTHLELPGRWSAGQYVKFRTDAKSISFRWTLLYDGTPLNMTLVSAKGLDLYVRQEDWVFCGVACPKGDKVKEDVIYCELLGEGEHEFMLYLPLFDGVDKLEIGVPQGCTFKDSDLNSPRQEHPVIVYGTSVVNGASSSRAGLAGTNLLSRMLDRTVINMGFSGNAHLDYEIAELMAAYPEPSAYVLDNVPNGTDSLIYARQERFYNILRDAHPQVPIIFVEECYRYRHDFYKAFQDRAVARNMAFRDVYQSLLKRGEKNIYFIEGDAQLDKNRDYTVDGSHFTDPGFKLWAEAVQDVLKRAESDTELDTIPPQLTAIQPHTVLELASGEGNPRNSEGDFLRLADGRILFAYSKYINGTGEDDDGCVIAARESSDMGESWSAEDRILATNTLDPEGNVMSVSLLRLDKKRIALFYLRKEAVGLVNIMMKVSSNEGKTWSKERNITAESPQRYQIVNNSRVLRLSTGRVIIPVAWHKCSADGKLEDAATMYCYYSDDNCKTWEMSQMLEVFDGSGKRVVTQEPGIIEMRDGNLLMYMRTYSGVQWYSYSHDGGQTWHGTQASPLFSPVSPATMLRLEDGSLLALWNNHEGRPDLKNAIKNYGVRTPLAAGLSFDDGQTWQYVKNLEDGYDPKNPMKYWYCYTAAIELEDRLLLAYCEKNGLCDMKMVSVPKPWLKAPDPAASANATLKPFAIHTTVPEQMKDENRFFQAAPSITMSPGGRLWVCNHTGGNGEGPDNGTVLVTSCDGGDSWSKPVMAIDPPGMLRVLDPGAWTDPDGKVWIFFNQVYDFMDGRVGLWVTHPTDSESEDTGWTEPRRLSDGYLKNKPLVLNDGRWLFPVEFMDREPFHVQNEPYKQILMKEPFAHPMMQMPGGNVYVSEDNGESLQYRGQAHVPEEVSDITEHMIVERKDGSLWMLLRVKNGIRESFSYDQGKTWTEAAPARLKNPSARFFIGRLNSGALLLIKNGPLYTQTARIEMTAYVSDDDGETWTGGLVLDPREKVSYPDAVQGKDGFIHAVNDYDRYGAEELVHHRFTEEDIRAGHIVTSGSRLGVVLNKAGQNRAFKDNSK